MSESPESIAKALKEAVTVNEESNNLPSLPLLYQEGFARFGGVKAFMDRVFTAFEEAKPGSQVQARLAEHFMEGIKVLQDRGMLGDYGNVESISDAEVDQEIDRLILKAARGIGA